MSIRFRLRMASARRGRPNLPSHAKRDEQIAILVTRTEKQLLVKKAKADGVKLSTWCRTKLLK